MARPLRIEFPGAYYHVMNRGLAHTDIFLNNKDRERFLVRISLNAATDFVSFRPVVR